MSRGRLILALLAGVLAGALAWHAAPAPAVQIAQPGQSTIQGVPACSTSPSLNDIFSYNGSTYCGRQSATVTGNLISNANICASTTSSCAAAPAGYLATQSGSGTGGIYFGGTGSWRIDFNVTVPSAFDVSMPLSIQGDSVMSAAPRMYFGGTLPVSPATSVLVADMVAPKAISFDNLRVWIPVTCTCATGPSIGLFDVTTSTTLGTAIPSCGTSTPTAVTLTTTTAAAGDEVQLKITNAFSCTTPPTVLSGGAMYHMQ